MSWNVYFAEEFEVEFLAFSFEVQKELAAQARWIEHFGPQAGRPRVDTLKGSEFSNMKELRFEAGNGVWRVAFAFDPERKAILLVAGDKAGTGEKKFYKALIDKADLRYRRHLARLKADDYRLRESKGESR